MSTDTNAKLTQWKALDPNTHQAEWLQLGLEIGKEVANNAKQSTNEKLIARIFLGIFEIMIKVSSLGRVGDESVKDDSQQPWLTIWPKLSAKPFRSPSVLKNGDLAREQWEDIRLELEALIDSGEGGFERAVYDGFGGTPWKTCYFDLFGQRNHKLHELCPKTSALLATLPDNHTHTCFSRIDAGATLPPHVGPSNA